jgi:hypothetical protein
MPDIRFIAIVLFLVGIVPSAGAQAPDQIAQEMIDYIGEREPVVIVGTHASLAEKSVLNIYLETNPQFSDIVVVDEADFVEEQHAGKVLMLIGGPSQNDISRRLLDKQTEFDEKNLAFGRVLFLGSGDAIILSDDEGFNVLRRRAENSPLFGHVAPELIPAVASGIGIGFIIIWKLLVALSTKVAKYKIVSFVMGRIRKKDIKQEFLGLHLKGIRIKVREWVAVLVSALVFAVSLSYMYLSPDAGVLTFFTLTVLVNFVVYTIRHSLRIMLDKVYDHHTEYYIWPYGAIITALTGWLGNTFGMAGYVQSEKDTEHEGKMAFIINLATFLFFAGFFVWNSLAPSIIAQMAMLLALAITYIQMLPINPFSGKNIYAWHRKLWIASFVPLTAIYIMINIL